MALKKKIKQPNGVELEYHRIAMVTIETNQQTTVLVRSYVNAEGRKYELDYAEGKITGEPVFPYTSGAYRSFEYSEDMDITNAYEWLKKQPDFEGAEDI